MNLSIIIPCYNAENHIERCLTSLVNQNFKPIDYEIIIIDDGSTDNSIKVIENFKNTHNNILLFKQVNKGQGYCRNRAIDLAKGDYIYFIDADDYLAHNSFHLVFDYLVTHKLDVVGFKTKITNELNLFDTSTTETPNGITITTGADFILKNKKHRLEAWWYIIKREYLIDSGFKFEEGKFLEDVVFTFKILNGSKRFAFLPMDIHRYVQNPNSTMQNETHQHLKRLIDGYLSLIFRLDDLKKEIYNHNTDNRYDVLKNVKYLSNSNTFYLFFKITKSNYSIKKINHILNQLIKIKAYPFDKEMITTEFTHYKIKTAAFIFNNKLLFYLLLYPLRVCYKIGFIKVP
jgi:glycosyltransferase involved in cell wall biosynthesis